MAWFRVDNRLVHGQVIEAWLPYLDATVLVVVNDRLAMDKLRQQIMYLAIPGRIQIYFVSMNMIKSVHGEIESRGSTALYLLADCRDVSRLLKEGVFIPVLNVGNLHYCQGKKHLCAHVAVSEEDLQCLHNLRKKGIRLDFRSVPTDMPVVEEW